ncbi:MAG: DNA-directed RNA polymerase subunit D [Candidatus Altiarchaeales archaeon]|nr:DNA-directed RNA polymerase subunit D [Candidatus Altiarchaeales archaeon]MBD3415685.1 DNA-directed RNA polymerase subunit D [Candidatus Altiarchaeales archaeon]
MKVTNFTKKGDVVEFDISGVDVAVLNAFRRTIVSGLPIMAMEKITFYNNSSILNDEILGHRIGLVPLTTDLKTYIPRVDCTCKGEGCAKCTATLTLDVSGPGTLYSGDFKSTDENIKPAYEKIPLVKLLSEQKVKAEAEAVMGYGSEHVKWQPGVAGYEIKDNGSFHVVVESYGPLPVDELIKNAFEVVGGKIGQLKEKIK